VLCFTGENTRIYRAGRRVLTKLPPRETAFHFKDLIRCWLTFLKLQILQHLRSTLAKTMWYLILCPQLRICCFTHYLQSFQSSIHKMPHCNAMSWPELDQPHAASCLTKLNQTEPSHNDKPCGNISPNMFNQLPALPSLCLGR